ncbi:MAG: hypothetical protein ABH863_05125 [Candidatus Micrarchaeota archaeon]
MEREREEIKPRRKVGRKIAFSLGAAALFGTGAIAGHLATKGTEGKAPMETRAKLSDSTATIPGEEQMRPNDSLFNVPAKGFLLRMTPKQYSMLIYASGQARVHPYEYADALAELATKPDSLQDRLFTSVADRADSVLNKIKMQGVPQDSLGPYLDALRRFEIYRTFYDMQDMGKYKWGSHPEMWESIKQQVREQIGKMGKTKNMGARMDPQMRAENWREGILTAMRRRKKGRK